MAKVTQPVREPCLKPTVPPPDRDARWIYSSGSPSSRQGLTASPAGPRQTPTITHSSLVLTNRGSNPAEGAKAPGATALSTERGSEGSDRGGTGGRVGRAEVEGPGAGGTGGNNVEGGAFGRASPADVCPADPVVGASPSAATSRASRRAYSRELRASGDRRTRRCSSTGEARTRAGSQVREKPVRGRGGERSGPGYGLSARPTWSPIQAAKAKDRKTGSGIGFGQGGGSCLSAGSPSVSPWCRQASSPADWGGCAGESLDGQDRGVVGWADDASGSNA